MPYKIDMGLVVPAYGMTDQQMGWGLLGLRPGLAGGGQLKRCVSQLAPHLRLHSFGPPVESE